MFWVERRVAPRFFESPAVHRESTSEDASPPRLLSSSLQPPLPPFIFMLYLINLMFATAPLSFLPRQQECPELFIASC